MGRKKCIQKEKLPSGSCFRRTETICLSSDRYEHIVLISTAQILKKQAEGSKELQRQIQLILVVLVAFPLSNGVSM